MGVSNVHLDGAKRDCPLAIRQLGGIGECSFRPKGGSARSELSDGAVQQHSLDGIDIDGVDFNAICLLGVFSAIPAFISGVATESVNDTD